MADKLALTEPETEIIPPNEFDLLGRTLFEEMEHLDPSEYSALGWGGLTEFEKEFYRSCARRVIGAYSSPTTTR